MTKVAYLGGAWATNIGNAFYNLGLLHFLRRLYGDDNVCLVPNLAGWYWQSPNLYDPVLDVEADLFVLSGPCFSRELQMYRPLLERVRDAGSKVAFLSVGAGKYDDQERRQVLDLLGAFADSLAFVSTRDSVTFEQYRALRCPVFDGICGSMFIDEAVNVPKLRRDPYIVLNVEARFEPGLRFERGQLSIDEAKPPSPRRAKRRFSRIGDRRSTPQGQEYPTAVGPYQIVRTQSRPFTRDAERLFDRPQTHYAVVPEGYFAIYKAAEMVISNRVHTCAATLVLGGTARYLTTDERAMDGRWFLLDRVGAGAVRERPTILDADRVATDKERMHEFVASQAV